jgi:hyperosmotically inducible protein
MKHLLFVVLVVAAAACDRTDRTESEGRAESPAADNTERNERDQNLDTLTPGDQAENEQDRTITQRVRQEVVGRDDLSTTAENVKIITVDGVVTLRGPVSNEQEQSTIAAIAQRVDGVKRVDNQLEIASR